MELELFFSKHRCTEGYQVLAKVTNVIFAGGSTHSPVRAMYILWNIHAKYRITTDDMSPVKQKAYLNNWLLPLSSSAHERVLYTRIFHYFFESRRICRIEPFFSSPDVFASFLMLLFYGRVICIRLWGEPFETKCRYDVIMIQSGLVIHTLLLTNSRKSFHV